MTDRTWQPGAAEQLWREQGGVERGWVSEMQVLAVASRTGGTTEMGWAVRHVSGSDEWTYMPIELFRTGVAKFLGTRLGTPALDASRVLDPGGDPVGDGGHGSFLDLEQGRLVLDIGRTRVLGKQLGEEGDICLVVHIADEAEELIGEGLQPWQVEMTTGSAGRH